MMYESEFRHGVNYALNRAADCEKDAVRLRGMGKPDNADRSLRAAARERENAAKLRAEYPEWAARLDANAPIVYGDAVEDEFAPAARGCDDYFGAGADA
jgi:hypothetical protein